MSVVDMGTTGTIDPFHPRDDGRLRDDLL